MDQPPNCFLGCIDVRSWTITVSIVNIILSMFVVISYICLLIVSSSNWRFGLILISNLNIILVCLNIILRRAVLNLDLKMIRLWLWVYLAVLVLSISWFIVSLIAATNLIDVIFIKNIYHGVNNLQIADVIFSGIMVIWLVGSLYPVYQFYNFENTL